MAQLQRGQRERRRAQRDPHTQVRLGSAAGRRAPEKVQRVPRDQQQLAPQERGLRRAQARCDRARPRPRQVRQGGGLALAVRSVALPYPTLSTRHNLRGGTNRASTQPAPPEH